jgi:hypothetical protein
MLSNAQKGLLKRAQKEAALPDEEYREALELIAGLHSSTDSRLGDRHLDKLLAYFEAIFWRKVDSGELQPPCKANAVFQKRAFWAEKNKAGETSRDRYVLDGLQLRIAQIEHALADLGYGAKYCEAIREKVTTGRDDVRALHHYRAALENTLKSKQKKAITAPF